MRDALDEVMLLQTAWSVDSTPEMDRRGELIRHEVPRWIRNREDLLSHALGVDPSQMRIEGSDGKGRKARIPWVRICDPRVSPSPTQGWYVVYLFAADGQSCWLTLMSAATTDLGDSFKPLPVDEIGKRVEWARETLGDRATNLGRIVDVDLASEAKLAGAYQRAAVTAIRYEFGEVPDADDLVSDLESMLALLAILSAQWSDRTRQYQDYEEDGDEGNSVSELALEQAHFDHAALHRERKRTLMLAAPDAVAGNNKMRALARKEMADKVDALPGPDTPVAFGRIDKGRDVFYIGRTLITDEDEEPLVLSWQSPASAAYYEATVDDPMGVDRKRQFLTNKNNIQSFEDVIYADLAERLEKADGTWVLNDTLLNDLNQGRTGEMRDIVQTIYAAQYEIIRQPEKRLLLVQGGPGTGKTAVALHRVSWLLYNEKSLQPEDVLVVGPNATFTRYIRSVLPILGDRNVEDRVLRGLGPTSSDARTEDADTARLKGEPRIADLLQRALRQRVRVPSGMERLSPAPGVVPIVASDLEDQIVHLLQAPTYNEGRSQMRGWLSRRFASGVRGSEASAAQIDGFLERIWPQLTAQSFVRDLWGSRERLLEAGGDDFTTGDVGRLYRPAAERLGLETWSDADVAVLDEADALISGVRVKYRHIVVDEAQDLSPMQLRSIRRRSRDGWMTVVGDIAQSTGAWARDDWDQVVELLHTDAEVVVTELQLGYRVPEQIYEFAARLLPLAAPGTTAPQVLRRGPADPDLIHVTESELARAAVDAACEHAGKGRFVGLVVPDGLRDGVLRVLVDKDVTFTDVAFGQLDQSINVASPEQAKGLEFDAVVVMEPERVVAAARGHRLLYVALTRTTKYLTVVHTGVAMPVGDGGHVPAVDAQAGLLNGTDRSHSDHAAGVGTASLPPVAPWPPPRVPSTAARSTTTPRPGARTTLDKVIASAVADQLAAQIRDSSLAPQHYELVIEALRRALGDDS